MPDISPPPNWKGSKPEWAVYDALTKLGYLSGRDFTYQASIAGGRLEYGGAILDFVIFAINIAINVQSTYYHYADPYVHRRDEMVRAMVEGMGLKLIYIDEEDALANALFYVKEALAGIDHSKMTGG
jgi:hypothetical protein